MLLGQGMWVLHLLVRMVMVTVMVKVDEVLWHSPLRHPLLLGTPPRPRHRHRFRHRHRVLRRSWVLLGQGMRVLHMPVRLVMMMVMVQVDRVLWHSRQLVVKVKMDWGLWHSCRVYVLVWEVMLHHGEPDGVMK